LGTLTALGLKLLDGFDKHVPSRILLIGSGDKRDRKLYRGNPTRFTGLHGAAYFVIVETAAALLQMKKWDLDAADVAGNTPILWAARNGRTAVLKVLLEQDGATPNTADREGRTPLLWAVAGGHREIMKILLDREDVTPDNADKCGETPLLRAAEFGAVHIAKMLLDREDLTPNTADKDGRTSLSRAAGSGCEEVVKVLLAREDVAPNTMDKDGQTALLWAVKAEHGCIVEMLSVPNRPVRPSLGEDGTDYGS